MAYIELKLDQHKLTQDEDTKHRRWSCSEYSTYSIVEDNQAVEVVSIHLVICCCGLENMAPTSEEEKHRLMHQCCRIHKRGPLVVELQLSAGQMQQ